MKRIEMRRNFDTCLFNDKREFNEFMLKQVINGRIAAINYHGYVSDMSYKDKKVALCGHSSFKINIDEVYKAYNEMISSVGDDYKYIVTINRGKKSNK